MSNVKARVAASIIGAFNQESALGPIIRDLLRDCKTSIFAKVRLKL